MFLRSSPPSLCARMLQLRTSCNKCTVLKSTLLRVPENRNEHTWPRTQLSDIPIDYRPGLMVITAKKKRTYVHSENERRKNKDHSRDNVTISPNSWKRKKINNRIIYKMYIVQTQPKKTKWKKEIYERRNVFNPNIIHCNK